jgi:hypothetical protein
MNVVGVVILASPPHDPIQSKRHNGRRLRALHTYSATTTPPLWSSKVRWSGRWDQQHDGVVLMVESICRQDFAYAREVEKDWQKKLVKTKATRYQREAAVAKNLSAPAHAVSLPFIGVRHKTALEYWPPKIRSISSIHRVWRWLLTHAIMMTAGIDPIDPAIELRSVRLHCSAWAKAHRLAGGPGPPAPCPN